MKTKLVQIGNSKGVRIPKALIEQAGLNGNVEMIVRGQELVLRSAKRPRAGWDEAFEKAIKEHGPIPELTEDERAFLDMPNEFDKTEEEWTW
jgi:antitoxin MazE